MKKAAAPPTTIDAYIAQYPKDVQPILESVRATIRKAAPKAEEKFGYGIPTFTLHGNLVHFGGFKNHVGFYPGAAGIAAFEKELSKFEGAKGSVQFPLDKPIPHTLISKIVKFRIKQNEAKAIVKKVKSKK